MPLSDHSQGIWLYDGTSEVEVLIIGDTDAAVSTVYGESSATLALLSSQAPIRIVGKMRGIEGTVTGFIMNALGRDASTDRASLISFLNDSTTARKLKFGSRDIPILIGNVKIDEWSDSEEGYAISFDFWQVGEFELEGSS